MTYNVRFKYKNDIWLNYQYDTTKIKKNSWHHLNEGLEAVYYSQFNKDVSKFNKALSLEPENIVAQLHKGRTLYKIEDFQNAIICFDIILSIDPKNLDAYTTKVLH